MSDVILISPDRLKRESYIDENVTENIIRVASIFVQDTIIQKVTGTCLMKALQELIEDGSICEPECECYKKLLDEFLIPIFIWGVPAEISIPLSYKNRNAGTIKTSSEGVTNSDLDEIKYLNNYYKNKMDFYVQRAIDYLCCNTQFYPELCCCCECAWYTSRPLSKQPTSPLNLHISPKRRELNRGYHSNWRID